MSKCLEDSVSSFSSSVVSRREALRQKLSVPGCLGIFSSSLIASPGSPDSVGGLGGFPGGARDTDRTLGRSVHVLGHACLAGLGRLRRRCCRERVFSAGRTLEPSKAAAEMPHQLSAGGGMHRRGDRR